MSNLPEYTGELACCEVCGYPDASTEYVPKSGKRIDPHRMDQNGNPWPADRFLKRTCDRCGFQWAEACVPPVDPATLFCAECRDTGAKGGEPCAACQPLPYQGPCTSVSGGDRCQLVEGHLGNHRRNHVQWGVGRCLSENLGDRCELAGDHMVSHRYGQREWAWLTPDRCPVLSAQGRQCIHDAGHLVELGPVAPHKFA